MILKKRQLPRVVSPRRPGGPKSLHRRPAICFSPAAAAAGPCRGGGGPRSSKGRGTSGRCVGRGGGSWAPGRRPRSWRRRLLRLLGRRGGWAWARCCCGHAGCSRWRKLGPPAARRSSARRLRRLRGLASPRSFSSWPRRGGSPLVCLCELVPVAGLSMVLPARRIGFGGIWPAVVGFGFLRP